jgi:hypothetical protein
MVTLYSYHITFRALHFTLHASRFTSPCLCGDSLYFLSDNHVETASTPNNAPTITPAQGFPVMGQPPPMHFIQYPKNPPAAPPARAPNAYATAFFMNSLRDMKSGPLINGNH